MLRALRLTAVLLTCLALPALGQTTAVPGKPTAPPPSSFTTGNRPPSTTTGTSPAAVTTGKRIDVNGASETELASLPGIGPVTAKNIVQGRPWDDLADLVKKKAMAQGVLDRNKDRLALANINTSSAADMAKTLPGIGDKTAPKIVQGRPYATPQDLVTKKVLTDGQFSKIKDLVTY